MTRIQKIGFIEENNENIKIKHHRASGNNRLVVDIIKVDNETTIYGRSFEEQTKAMNKIDELFFDTIARGNF